MDVMLETFSLTMKVTTLVAGEKSDGCPILKQISNDDTTGRVMSVKSRNESSVSEIKPQLLEVDFGNSEKGNCPIGNKGSKSKSRKKMWRKVDLKSVFPEKPLSLEVIFGAEIAIECEKKRSVHLSYAAVAQKNTGAVWKSSEYQMKGAIQDRGIDSRSEAHCSLPKNSFLTDHCLFPKISYQPKDRHFLLPKSSYQTEDHWLFPGNRYKTEDRYLLPTSSTLPEDHFLLPKKSYKAEDCCVLSRNSCLTLNHSLFSDSICHSENTPLLPKKHAKTGDNCLVPKKHAKTGDNFLVPKKHAKTGDNCLISKKHAKTGDSRLAPKNDAKTGENFLLPENDAKSRDNYSLSEGSFDYAKENLISEKNEERDFLTKKKYLPKYPSLHSKDCYPTEDQRVPPKDSHQNDSGCLVLANSYQIKDCYFLSMNISQIRDAYSAVKNNYKATVGNWLLSGNSYQWKDISVLPKSDSSSEDLDFLPHYIYWSEDYRLVLKYSYEIEDGLLIPRNMSKVQVDTVDENTSQIRDLTQKSISDKFDLHHSHCCKRHNEKVNNPYTLMDIVKMIKSDTKQSRTETDDLAENIAINGLDLGTTSFLASKLWGSGRKRMAYTENLSKDQKTATDKETIKEFYPRWKGEQFRKWGITCNRSGCLHEDL